MYVYIYATKLCSLIKVLNEKDYGKIKKKKNSCTSLTCAVHTAYLHPGDVPIMSKQNECIHHKIYIHSPQFRESKEKTMST